MARILALLLVLSFTLPALAVPVPPMNGVVNDPENQLSLWQRKALIQQVSDLNARTGTQTALLLIPTTNGETIEHFANEVFNRWQLGDARRNDGVLVLVAWQDRKVRIEVGSGLEDMLTNALAKQIIDEYMIPAFRQNDLNTGIVRGVEGISTVLASQPLPKAQPPSFFQQMAAWFSLWKSLIVLAVVIIALTIKGKIRTLAGLFFIACPLAVILFAYSEQNPLLLPFTIFCAAVPAFILLMMLCVWLLYPQRLTAAGRQKYRESRQLNYSRGGEACTDTTHYTSSESSGHSSSESSGHSSSDSSSGGGGSSDGSGSSGNW
ncbi:TPM domain-containing protein [Kosakonia sacchari]|uniref:TPM domain-containing protein n=1 Tax=Kosakonia sacchari TaxID=1158459 RepID=UPI0025B04B8A|nr:TPM domain-containing protein [Kosakonia sacchari]MDN2487924.1 TPM domain-containing protein [Kosakonia sacchari]